MKRLCELVDIGINNEACVLFKVKDSARMDLITLGCFRGDEDMIRMTKGRQPTVTLYYKDGGTASYYFGEGGHTVLAESGAAQREMIRECAILDFGIVCDLSYANLPYSDEMFIANTLDVQRMSDAERGVSLVSGGGMSGHIKINSQIMAHDVHVKDVPGWFEKRGYHVSFEQDISKGLPCGKVYGECVPAKDYQISQMPHELSKDRLVRYVQEELGCDKDRAAEFIKGFHEATLLRNAKNALACYNYEIVQAGLRVPKLTDDELVELGKSLEKLEGMVLADAVEDEAYRVVRFVKEHQDKTIDGLISDANQRAAGASEKSEVDFEKEL